MLHHVAHMDDDRLALRDWAEARELWDQLVAHAPGLAALVVMPNHFHLLHARDVRLELGIALSAFTRWRNVRLGRCGPTWRPMPPAEPIDTDEKRTRNVRYVHLNPCRARLARCPLDWPFSTHRDACGLVIHPVRSRVKDTDEFHRYVSSDASVAVDGTLLPTRMAREPSLDEVEAAVSAVLRAPLADLGERGPARKLLIHSARALTTATPARIAERFDVSVRLVQRAPTVLRAPVMLVARVAGDRRFPALDGAIPGWRRG